MSADRIRAAWQRVLKGTVWEPGALNDTPPEYRSIFRFWLPLVDIIFIWFGVVGVTNGIDSVKRALSPDIQLVWSGLLAIAAALALVGIAVRRYWALELAAKTVLITLVSLYLAVSAGRSVNEPGVAATAGVLFIIVFFPFWRATNLGTKVWQRFWARRRRRKAPQS